MSRKNTKTKLTRKTAAKRGRPAKNVQSAPTLVTIQVPARLAFAIGYGLGASSVR